MYARMVTGVDDWYGQASSLLRAGNYREGFEAWELRPTRLNHPPRFQEPPEWNGESLEGKRLLVWGEQGLGDEIQMARFIGDLKRLGARHISFGCRRPNMQLFVGIGADILFDRNKAGNLPRWDAWIGSFSLPHRLGVTLETLSGVPYLRPAGARRRGGVGLVWRGNPAHDKDKFRSLPSPDILTCAFPRGVLLEPAGAMIDSARQLLELDAIVTVDTAWAHLAGALGVPAFVLLSSEWTDWRWGDAGERSPWYDSLTLCRQDEPGDWSSAIAKALAGLS